MGLRTTLVRSAIALVLGSALAACGDDPGEGIPPRFVAAACPDGIDDATVECGFVVVPEDRSDPGGPAVRLAVARLAALSDEPDPTPIVVLAGGPGQSLMGDLDAYRGSLLRRDRDLILFDQRGVGRSEPALECPERTEAVWANFASSDPPEVELGRIREAAVACFDRLRASGVRPESYDTVSNALDVTDVRRALGIERWHVYAGSYGTTLALEILRSHPDGVRSVLLDATYPLDETGYDRVAGAWDRAFGRLVEACNDDPTCRSGVEGDLRGFFAETVAEYDAEPLAFDVVDSEAGQVRSVRIDGRDLVGGIFDALYDTRLIPALPSVIRAVRDRNRSLVEGAFGRVGARNLLSAGMFLTVECRDRDSSSRFGEVLALLAERPELTTIYSYLAPPVCDALDVGAVEPSFHQPVRSDVPALVFGGEFDPITPPEWGARVVETLSRGTFFAFPGVGHGAFGVHPCPTAIASDFWNDPEAVPDGSCIAGMPAPFASDGDAAREDALQRRRRTPSVFVVGSSSNRPEATA